VKREEIQPAKENARRTINGPRVNPVKKEGKRILKQRMPGEWSGRQGGRDRDGQVAYL